MRIPMIRRTVDGTITDGTCECVVLGDRDRLGVTDFRDLDGELLTLASGDSFEIVFPLVPRS